MNSIPLYHLSVTTIFLVLWFGRNEQLVLFRLKFSNNRKRRVNYALAIVNWYDALFSIGFVDIKLSNLTLQCMRRKTFNLRIHMQLVQATKTPCITGLVGTSLKPQIILASKWVWCGVSTNLEIFMKLTNLLNAISVST